MVDNGWLWSYLAWTEKWKNSNFNLGIGRVLWPGFQTLDVLHPRGKVNGIYFRYRVWAGFQSFDMFYLEYYEIFISEEETDLVSKHYF